VPGLRQLLPGRRVGLGHALQLSFEAADLVLAGRQLLFHASVLFLVVALAGFVPAPRLDSEAAKNAPAELALGGPVDVEGKLARHLLATAQARRHLVERPDRVLQRIARRGPRDITAVIP